MTGYEVRITECSRDLTGKEKVALKDTTDAQKLDSLIQAGEEIIIDPDYTAVLEIHNEHAENKDYKVFVLVDKEGKKYITSSESFISSFENIQKEMEGEDEEWAIKVYKIESKNFKGRHFITCSIA